MDIVDTKGGDFIVKAIQKGFVFQAYIAGMKTNASQFIDPEWFEFEKENSDEKF